MPTRRETLLGAGTLVAGAGAVAGTGAFGTEGASQGMTVGFADDADAILAMSPGREGRSYVEVEGDDGTVSIRITRTNSNARTVVSDLVTFTNNGTQTIRDITFGITDRSEGAEVSVHGDMEGVNLAPGQSVTGLGIAIDTRDHAGTPTIEGRISVTTITALEGQRVQSPALGEEG